MQKMSPGELKNEITEFLSEHKDGALGTCINQMPRTSPVQYFMGKEMELYILSAGGDKFEAIESNPNVCMLVNTEYLNHKEIKGVQIFGKAITSVTNKQLYDEAMQFSEDPNKLNMERENLKVIKIVPEEIVYLNAVKTGDRTKQILKNDQVTVKEDAMTLH
ncbi:pyridoxamine 5'-phosphate oxidase family protein [Serpentinicella sp. ANB-PHB4]|uniref:pyridoxamine 5'-phosphate oxidase family protein n=1 Tax=Serpentinicella sp. ANB-PHB4 TaxID=3074076 RepID=UPI002866C7AB|nr:pyridoxamine 5'-phosphate oxidase family protein [Serpentinicella sp. ANB-PHB4]MDR5659205.1 pyridoxamine 5'-phosphate oxidase family protein [Serpentinicella sp. ANB-PHB4]